MHIYKTLSHYTFVNLYKIIDMFMSNVNFFNAQTYNYWIELSSIIFLGVLLIRFILSKKFRSSINYLFGCALICGMIDMTLDVVGSIMIDKYQNIPVELNITVNSFFYLFQIIFPFLLFVFVVYFTDFTFKNNKLLWLTTIPIFGFIILLIVNPFTNILFSFDYNATDGILKHGSLFILYYVDFALYIALILGFIFYFRKKINKSQVIALCVSLSIIVGLVIIQLIVSEILLTGLAITLSCWILFEKMANPVEMVDKVTGVFNFTALNEFLSNEIKQKKRNCYYIVLNVENITPINNAFGIKISNEIYKEIGSYFNSICKNNTWSFRFLNSRFIFACKDEARQLDIINNINLRFQTPWIASGNKFDLKCQIYYFKDSPIITSHEEFIDFSNSLDSQVKRKIEEKIVYIDEDFIDTLSRKRKVESALNEAIKNNFEGFELYYQPIYDVASKKFRVSEALLRFKNKKLGAISPAEFIPIAESCGLAKNIDDYVLKNACEFLQENPSIEGISINISYTEFFNNPAEKFLKIIESCEINPKRLCFEVTETATIEYSDKIDDFINEMSHKGFSFAVDDFGTGYSNISRFVSKAFGFVKLDKIFLTGGEKMEIILKNMILLFKQLNIPILIEGVETEEQLNKVINLGVDYIQGFYYSRPLPKDAYLKFIENQK